MRLVILGLLFASTMSFAGGNETIQSFNKAKKILQNKVYHDNRVTLYCSANFDGEKNVIPPLGFTATKHKKRAKRIEWEHVVPAENFGRTFSEWRDGHQDCVNKKGKSFKGRNCASKMNKEYRYMQADMYNLFPAIGSVNAMRSNYNFAAVVDAKSSFGSCAVKILDKKVEPPVNSRGRIARTYLYMHGAYQRYKMSKQQLKLMTAWDKMYPVTEWECERAQRILAIQGNENRIMSERCGLKN